MNDAFRSALIARLEQLTGHLLFDHAPTRGKIAPQIIDTMLTGKGQGYEKNEEFPFIRVALCAGEFRARRPAPFVIHLVGGVYTAGSVADGVRDITQLTLALGEIVNSRSFPPYKLADSVSFSIGDPAEGSEGLQPHPMYYMTMKLEFISAV